MAGIEASTSSLMARLMARLTAAPAEVLFWPPGLVSAVTVTHRRTSITVVPVRPKISGVYISSARAGAVRNVPAVVARAT